MSRFVHLSIVPVLICAAPSASLAQGQQSGVLSGRVSSADRLPLPGVTVTATSTALQGQRVATTDINGVYSLPGLPPGGYAVKFALDGMAAVGTRGGRPARQRGGCRSADGTRDRQRGRRSARRHAVGGDVAPCGQITAAEITVLPVGRTPFLLAETAAGADRQYAERGSGHDVRFARLRQRVPDERRRHQRQRARHRQQSVHRGRDPGSAGR